MKCVLFCFVVFLYVGEYNYRINCLLYYPLQFNTDQMGEEQGYSHIVQKMANSYILFVVMFIFSFLLCLWITWDDPVNKETPNSTYANFKEFPRTNGLISPKDTKENLLNF